MKSQDKSTLSSETKEQIRLEEIFRQEIRQALEKDTGNNTFRAKALKFFNTSLGIWLLSTIVVGIFSWSYSQYQLNASIEKSEQESSRKIDLEISSRLSNYYLLVNQAKDAEDIYNAHDYLKDPNYDKSFPFIYPEYEKRGLLSLLWELQSTVPVEDIIPIYRAITVFQKAQLRIVPLRNSDNVTLKAEKAAALQFLEDFRTRVGWDWGILEDEF